MRANGRDEDGVSISGVTALRGSEKALLCRIPDGDSSREVWIPRSQLTDDSEIVDVGDEGELVIKSWFAEREGLS